MPEPDPTFSRTVDSLRAQCRAMKLDDKGNKPQLIERIEREQREAAAWRDLLANPPVYPSGYRIIFDGDIEVPLVLDAHPASVSDRIMFVRCRYTLPASISGIGHDQPQETAAPDEEAVIWTARRNIGANYPAAEFLRPGQRSRAELAAELVALRAATERPDPETRAALRAGIRVGPTGDKGR